MLVPDFTRNVYCIFGLPFDAVDLAAAERRIRIAITERRPCFLSTPNLNFLISSHTNAAFRDSVLHSDLSIADGIPIVWLAKLLGIPIRNRVAGSALFEQLARATAKPIRVFFFGGKDGVAESACNRLNATASGMRCVGFKSPGFGSVADMSDEVTIARINASDPDFVIVSLGAAKGQAWIEANRERLSAPVVSHLGAVINFTAGAIKRAPTVLQALGFEWLWRIKEEPSLWRRYFRDGTALLKLAIKDVVPLMLLRLRWSLIPNNKMPQIVIRHQVDVAVVHLSGAWRHRDLVPLRKCFTELTSTNADIILDLSRITRIDSAFVGLLMLLHGYQGKRGRPLSIAAVGKSASAYLKHCRADFLYRNLAYYEEVTGSGITIG